MQITVDLKSKNEMLDKFGHADKPNKISIRYDLPLSVQMSVLVHEYYHLKDPNTNFRELRAIFAQIFYPIIGFIKLVYLKLKYKMVK